METSHGHFSRSHRMRTPTDFGNTWRHLTLTIDNRRQTKGEHNSNRLVSVSLHDFIQDTSDSNNYNDFAKLPRNEIEKQTIRRFIVFFWQFWFTWLVGLSYITELKVGEIFFFGKCAWKKITILICLVRQDYLTKLDIKW